ncbi:hypothetical protein H5410_045986 [Solanum commersonii]|uniref:Uncharacterized protein n=1 Tax=Solanum commersonii TaxID=4109 RepID=A0A9J5XF88_SOLCO|nr:hypothetical protein H5410_045986 [Solanum commersonii]
MYISTIATSLPSEILSYDETTLEEHTSKFLVVLGVQKGLFLHLGLKILLLEFGLLEMVHITLLSKVEKTEKNKNGY